jgi:hypothetical protein
MPTYKKSGGNPNEYSVIYHPLNPEGSDTEKWNKKKELHLITLFITEEISLANEALRVKKETNPPAVTLSPTVEKILKNKNITKESFFRFVESKTEEHLKDYAMTLKEQKKFMKPREDDIIAHYVGIANKASSLCAGILTFYRAPTPPEQQVHMFITKYPSAEMTSKHCPKVSLILHKIAAAITGTKTIISHPRASMLKLFQSNKIDMVWLNPFNEMTLMIDNMFGMKAEEPETVKLMYDIMSPPKGKRMAIFSIDPQQEVLSLPQGTTYQIVSASDLFEKKKRFQKTAKINKKDFNWGTFSQLVGESKIVLPITFLSRCVDTYARKIIKKYTTPEALTEALGKPSLTLNEEQMEGLRLLLPVETMRGYPDGDEEKAKINKILTTKYVIVLRLHIAETVLNTIKDLKQKGLPRTSDDKEKIIETDLLLMKNAKWIREYVHISSLVRFLGNDYRELYGWKYSRERPLEKSNFRGKIYDVLQTFHDHVDGEEVSKWLKGYILRFKADK